MPVEGLGHVGLYVKDLATMRLFYEQTIGLTVTDEVVDAGLVFMSARPEHEHHELLLIAGDPGETATSRLNQVSFRCARLEDVHDYWTRFRALGVPIDMTVSHGNAVGVYFRDPEENTVEVYWDTGLEARQPYMEHVEFELGPDGIRSRVQASVREHGTPGFVGPEFAAPDA